MKLLRNFCSLVAVPAALLLAVGSVPAQDSFRNVTDGVNKKVAKLFGSGGFKGLVSYGTGIMVSPRGHILTLSNHLLDTRDLRVHLYDGRKFHAKVIAKEPALDLALAQIIDYKNDDLPYFDFASECKRPLAEAGDWVLAFSNQFKIANREEPMSVMRGVIAAYCKLHGRRGVADAPFRGDVYFVDAITNNPGAAGGVLTTRKGELLGIVGRELRNRLSDTWINYAVPIQAKVEITREGKKVMVDVATFIDEGMKGIYKPGERPKHRQGANVETGVVLVPNVVERTPPYVEEVVPDSPAAKVGLKPDDLIVYMDGEFVGTITQFHELLANYRPGDTVQLEIQRNKELMTIKLVLAKPAVVKTGPK
jgi:serine protease Do